MDLSLSEDLSEAEQSSGTAAGEQGTALRSEACWLFAAKCLN